MGQDDRADPMVHAAHSRSQDAGVGIQPEQVNGIGTVRQGIKQLFRRGVRSLFDHLGCLFLYNGKQVRFRRPLHSCPA